MKHQKAAVRKEPVTETIVLVIKKLRLSRPQWLVLLELDEPNDNDDGAWYFPHKDKRTLQVLASHGLAEKTEENRFKIGYRLTVKGKDYVRAMTISAVQP